MPARLAAAILGFAAPALIAPVPGLAGPIATAAATADTLPDSWCSAGASAPCIVSATRNASPVAEHDPTYYIQLSPFGDRGSSASPITIRGLRASPPYRCTVRAKSNAGLGQSSAPVRLPA